MHSQRKLHDMYRTCIHYLDISIIRRNTISLHTIKSISTFYEFSTYSLTSFILKEYVITPVVIFIGILTSLKLYWGRMSIALTQYGVWYHFEVSLNSMLSLNWRLPLSCLASRIMIAYMIIAPFTSLDSNFFSFPEVEYISLISSKAPTWYLKLTASASTFFARRWCEAPRSEISVLRRLHS